MPSCFHQNSSPVTLSLSWKLTAALLTPVMVKSWVIISRYLLIASPSTPTTERQARSKTTLISSFARGDITGVITSQQLIKCQLQRSGRALLLLGCGGTKKVCVCGVGGGGRRGGGGGRQLVSSVTLLALKCSETLMTFQLSFILRKKTRISEIYYHFWLAHS